MRELLGQAKKLFVQDPNLIRAEGNVVIIGDIHGQFMDMMNMFDKLHSEPGKNKIQFVFLGDYVDRGEFGCEVMGYLLALKL
jgi:serine/threonine-protein phosphatase 2B catalytic subunit